MRVDVLRRLWDRQCRDQQAFVHGAPRPHSKYALTLDPSPALQAGSG